MKIGLIARAEDRGLGIMCWEFARHVEPDRTLVVRHPSTEAIGFPAHLERYPGAEVVTVSETGLPEERVRAWLEGLDVVYTAEVPYDPALFEWCRDAGVVSVLHTMPEAWHPSWKPDVVWAPTGWRLETLPAETRLVPVPVALDRFRPRVRQEPTFLHLVGHRAAADRAGTGAVLKALRRLRVPCRVVLATQDARLPALPSVSALVDVEVQLATHREYWEAYDGASVLLGPRRYGGLSLPWNEAAAAGLALVLSGCAPNPQTWPGLYLSVRRRDGMRVPTGSMDVWDPVDGELEAAMTRLALEPELVADLSSASIVWVQERSWACLLGLYLTELERACR